MPTETKIPALTDLEQRRRAPAIDGAHGRDGAEQERHEAKAHLTQKRQAFRQAVEEYLAVGRSVYGVVAALTRMPDEKRRGKDPLNLCLQCEPWRPGGRHCATHRGPAWARQASFVDLLRGQAYAGPRKTEE